MEKIHDNVMFLPDGAIYFTDTTDVNRIFDSRLSYDKGSAVIHTLRFILGDDLFFDALKNFQKQFSFSTDSIDDLHHFLQTFTGKNLDDYFAQWIYGEGYPTFIGEYNFDGNSIFLKINQTTSSTITPIFKTPIEILLHCTNGDTIIKIEITKQNDEFMIPSTKQITGITFDPNNWLLNKELISVRNNNLNLYHFIGSGLEVYPNPVNDFLEIKNGSYDEIQYVLYNILGEVIAKDKFIVKSKIKMNEFPKGTYFLALKSKSINDIKKIIKQ